MYKYRNMFYKYGFPILKKSLFPNYIVICLCKYFSILRLK